MLRTACRIQAPPHPCESAEGDALRPGRLCQTYALADTRFVRAVMQWCGQSSTARHSSARGCPAWGGLPLLDRGIPPGYLPTPGHGASVPAAVGKGV